MQEDNSYRIHHQVQLPGGRNIEVVYLDSNNSRTLEEQPPTPTSDGVGHARSTPAPQSPRYDYNKERRHSDAPVATTPRTGSPPSTLPGQALHVCPSCAGGLVHPLDWFEESPGQWRILMRCPDCDLLRDGVFGQALVERLDDELDRATSALLSDLKRVTHANMLEEIELFSQALELDLIGPNDF